MNAQPQWTGYIVGIVIMLAVFAFRAKRMGRMRPLKVARLWVMPAIIIVVAALMFWHFPPTGWAIPLCLFALVLGAGLGWWRGRMMRISVDPATHALNYSASPAAMLFLVAIVAVRAASREALAAGSGTLHLNAMAVSDIAISFAVGLLSVQRVEMYLRAKRLHDEARGLG